MQAGYVQDRFEGFNINFIEVHVMLAYFQSARKIYDVETGFLFPCERPDVHFDGVPRTAQVPDIDLQVVQLQVREIYSFLYFFPLIVGKRETTVA